jgi:hypothetical protein
MRLSRPVERVLMWTSAGGVRLGPMRPTAYSDAVSQSQTVPENAVVTDPE